MQRILTQSKVTCRSNPKNDTITPMQETAIVRHLKQKIPTMTTLYLFGSIATNTDTPDSDIDLAVVTNAPVDTVELWNIAQELAILLKKDVDLIHLNTASTVLRYEIIMSGRLLYTQDPDATAAQEGVWMSEYVSFNETRQDLLDDIKKRGAVYG